MLKVLIVGQTPPPYGGQGIMIERFVRAKLDDVQLLHVRMGFSTDMDTVGRVSWKKIFHMFEVIARVWYYRFFHGVRILYYPPGGPDRVSMYRDVAVLFCTRFLFDKLVLHFHAGGISELEPGLPFWMRWFYRRALYNADAAIRLSELNPEDAKLLRAKTEYIIPYGIDDPAQSIDLPRPAEAITAERPLKILYVAILRESKGLLDLVEACGLLAQRGVPFDLQVVGQWHSDEFRELLLARIQELRIGQHITFRGQLIGQDKFDAYAQADVFSMPTFFNCETFGVVYIEAMAHGLPVVATRWRGVPSVVKHEQTGFIVEVRDCEAIADRLQELAEDAELRVSMGLAGRERFLAEYVWPRYAARMRQVLLETAGVADPSNVNVTETVSEPLQEAIAV